MLSQQTQALTRERQKLEAEAAKRKSHQSTMSKAVKNLTRQARGIVEQIHEIEMGKSQDHRSNGFGFGFELLARHPMRLHHCWWCGSVGIPPMDQVGVYRGCLLYTYIHSV